MITFVDLTTDELEDGSYTLSMDLPTQSWISFHDWIPSFQFSSRNQLFSIYENRLYLHNQTRSITFYENNYFSSITPVLVSTKETLDQKEAFTLNRISVGGSLPTRSWIFNQYQTSQYTNWVPRDDTKSLLDNYRVSNCYFEDGHWQFNAFKNCRKNDNFWYSRRDQLYLEPNSTELKTTNNIIKGDHVVVNLTFITYGWIFTDIGFNVSWNE